MNFKEQESSTKLRGGYYTPAPIARFLANWVAHKRPNSILEPSCGDGAFVRAFSDVKEANVVSFTGVELLKEEADKAQLSLREEVFINDSQIVNADFLEWSTSLLNSGSYYDAVVGNPPYIRYQYLELKDQELAAQIFARYQLPFTKHTNAWVPFVIASLGLLAPGGRLAMVIPSEILHVLHANSLRQFLLAECHRILLIDPTELLFEEALQGTVLLMVEKKLNRTEQSEGVSVISATNNDFLMQNPEDIYENASYVTGDILNGKWMKVLLSDDELNTFEKVLKLDSIQRFRDIASVDVGIVTGANKFFLIDDATVDKYELNNFVRPMFGRSEHCPGIIYDNTIHLANKERGLPANFLMFGKVPLESLPDKAREYVSIGENQKLHTRYKCRIRNPWYSVPSVYSTPIGMLKRSHNFPRLILNSADALTTDTAYRIKATDITIPDEKLVFCFINSLTALTAELEGRHYGGGVLELVPSEIEKLRVPIPSELTFDLKSLDEKVKAGIEPHVLLAEQDEIVLKAAGLTDQDCKVIQQAWSRIRGRRHRLVDMEG
ncbi:N-6 DNA methylase [Paenibacillus sp.]|uniref:N-6 DNA methylase n=1 Tax=Paenibacillus sp. TaxID=58172 RepID=UPI00282D093A|nr:N-6 DNA methylase [Paenibacillus sp.]MDR0269857.1 N-6 DNA methylase [Paenibacillus sp.]